ATRSASCPRRRPRRSLRSSSTRIRRFPTTPSRPRNASCTWRGSTSAASSTSRRPTAAGCSTTSTPTRTCGRRSPRSSASIRSSASSTSSSPSWRADAPSSRTRHASPTGATIRPMQPIDDPAHDHEVGVRDSTQDTTRIDDVRIAAVRPLISPALLLDDLPVPPGVQALVERARAEIAAILRGRDDRAIVVVGPCSIHDHDEALDYAGRLAELAAELRGELAIVMRIYFEKPRTTVGWKGYINDPLLDGSFRINEGLRRARRLLLDVAGLGVPPGTEFLDLLSPQYIAALVVWAAIGARTTESQTHRQLASGLSCPVGFKNGTDGSIRVAVDALRAAAAPHAFMGMTKTGQAAIFETVGNDDTHVILRGGKVPNHDARGVDEACVSLARA